MTDSQATIVEIHQSLGPLEVQFLGQFSGLEHMTTKMRLGYTITL